MSININDGDIIVDEMSKNIYIYKNIDMSKGGLLSFYASLRTILFNPETLKGSEKWKTICTFRKPTEYEAAYFTALLNSVGKSFNQKTKQMECWTNKSRFNPCEQVLVAIPFQYILKGRYCYEEDGKYVIRFSNWIYKARPSEVIPCEGNEHLNGKSYENIFLAMITELMIGKEVRND